MKSDREQAIFQSMCNSLAWGAAAAVALSLGSTEQGKRWGEASDAEKDKLEKLLGEEANELH